MPSSVAVSYTHLDFFFLNLKKKIAAPAPITTTTQRIIIIFLFPDFELDEAAAVEVVVSTAFSDSSIEDVVLPNACLLYTSYSEGSSILIVDSP